MKRYSLSQPPHANEKLSVSISLVCFRANSQSVKKWKQPDFGNKKTLPFYTKRFEKVNISPSSQRVLCESASCKRQSISQKNMSQVDMRSHLFWCVSPVLRQWSKWTEMGDICFSKSKTFTTRFEREKSKDCPRNLNERKTAYKFRTLDRKVECTRTMYSRLKNKDVSAEMFCVETQINALQFSSGYETLKSPK